MAFKKEPARVRRERPGDKTSRSSSLEVTELRKEGRKVAQCGKDTWEGRCNNGVSGLEDGDTWDIGAALAQDIGEIVPCRVEKYGELVLGTPVRILEDLPPSFTSLETFDVWAK